MGRKVFLTNRVFGRLPFPRKILEDEIFRNHPGIVYEGADGFEKAAELRLDNRLANYWTRITKNKIYYKPDAHAIETACRAYGLKDPEIRCEIHLDQEELAFGGKYLDDIGPYVVIEPHTKDSFTVNKRYGFSRWQEVADSLSRSGIKLVQVGEGGKRILNNVVDATGIPSIRKVASIIQHARALVAPEGGLMHLASGVGTRAVIVFGGYVSPELTGYKDNINIFSSLPCAPCGLRRRCIHDTPKCMDDIRPEEIIEGTLSLLKG
jgi:ADP-heptose:LPS heptosyltransferase